MTLDIKQKREEVIKQNIELINDLHINKQYSEELLMLEIIWLKLLSMEEKIKELKNA